MIKGYYFLFFFGPNYFISKIAAEVEKETLIRIIIIQAALLLVILGIGIIRALHKRYPSGLFLFSRLFRRVKLEIILEKDRPLRPQVLTMIIRNTGKHVADINAPVLEFKKIWSNRKFKLNSINGNHNYPMFIEPGRIHQLRIETSTFYQYDRSIKSFYWARICVSDVKGRHWKSDKIKLRKSLVT